MKLLIAGSDEVWSLEKFYIRHLQNEGVEVEICQVQSMFYKYYQKSIINKLLFKAGLSNIYREIGNKVRNKIEEFQPDVLWVFKGMELTPDLLKWVKEKNIRLVNYNPDNPFLFSGTGSGNSNVTESIGLYDLHLTYDRNIQEQIIREYKTPCSILPFGFEISNELYAECVKQEEILKVCFLGNPDVQRGNFINQLAEKIPVDVYGHNWDKLVSHKNVQVHGPVYGKDFWKTLYKYRIQLNLMRPHNPQSHNMRSFEVPGVGGIGLFPYTPDHDQYFVNGKEIFLYKDIDECAERSKELLGLSTADAKKIRIAARSKSISSGYSYRDRASQALTEISTLLS